MSWTDQEVDQIVSLMGMAATADNLAVVSAKMGRVVSTATITRIRSYLVELAQIETQIETARNLPGSALPQLKTEARRFTRLVSIAFSIDVQSDIW